MTFFAADELAWCLSLTGCRGAKSLTLTTEAADCALSCISPVGTPACATTGGEGAALLEAAGMTDAGVETELVSRALKGPTGVAGTASDEVLLSRVDMELSLASHA